MWSKVMRKGKEYDVMDVKTEFLCELSGDLEDPLVVGVTPRGNRVIAYIKGGTVKGPKLNGEVLPGGGDWALFRPDGVLEADVRGTIRTDDGHLIYTHYRGIINATGDVWRRVLKGEPVDPSEYYFRVAPVFETASEKYSWLNNIIAVGVGTIAPNRICYNVYWVL